MTEWDRFAHREYIRLSMEEDGEDASNGSGDIWDEPLESPFWDWLGKWNKYANSEIIHFFAKYLSL